MSANATPEMNLEVPLLTQNDRLQTEESSSSSAAAATVSTRRNQRNVRLTLIYTAIAFAGRSIWSQSVLATFVYFLRDNNPEAVGYITAVMGLSQLVASFPAGFVSDSYRRDSLLQLASMVGIVALISTILACYHESYRSLVVALAAWGTCYGVANTSLAALFADSIETGQRSHYFTQRSILITLGNTVGPATALVLFAFLGNDWSIGDCAFVMCVGQAVCFPALLILCFFRDSNHDSREENDLDSLNDSENGRHGTIVSVDDATHSINQFFDTNQIDIERDLLLPEDEQNRIQSRDTCVQAGEETATLASTDTDGTAINVIFNGCCLPRHRVIPVFIALSDIIAGLGSGMSIRYFPLFFMNQLSLNPVQVQAVYVIYPMLQTILMKLSQRLAKRYGRCHVTVAFKWTGIFFFAMMIVAYSVFDAHPWYICVLFVFRTGFMNCCSALTKSMLMDNVPSHERGKWSALESVNMFSWSGSAAFGGVVVGLVGIVPLFCITASIQFVSSLVVVSLFGVDENESSSS